MKLTVLIAGNAVLLSGLLWWLRAEYQRATPGLRRWLLPALGWRLLLTAVSGYYPSPDAHLVARGARLLVANFWAQPTAVLALWQGNQFQAHGESMTLYSWSNTLYFIKLLAALSLVTGDNLWLNNLYLSWLCFIACWALVRVLSQTLPHASTAAAGVAFLAWPTVVWWTAGLTKETVLVGASAGLFALVLPALYSGRPLGLRAYAGHLMLALLLAWIMVRMRYFFGLPLVGGLLAFAAVRLATRRGWLGPGSAAQALGLLLVLALAGGVALALGGTHLTVDFLSSAVDVNYQHGLRTSLGRPHLEYAHWQPTPAGLLRYAPLAAAQTLVRPWPGESTQPLYVGAGLENVLVMALVGLALVAAGRGRVGRLPAALVVMLLVYCLLLAAFIGLSTPNLGTLSRYRAALLPWLLLLLLQNDYARRLLKRLGL